MSHSSENQLQSILKQLQQIIVTLNLKIVKSQESDEQTAIYSIKQYVSQIFDQIVKKEPAKTGQLWSQTDLYVQIEKDLQKQQNLNRLLIRKELQFKEYQKCLNDQLNEEKKSVKKLKNQLTKINEKVVSKDMEIMHMSNEKKILSKDRRSKQFIPLEALLSDKKTLEGLSSINKNLLPEFNPTHVRRRSDDISKKPSSANPKKKASTLKR